MSPSSQSCPFLVLENVYFFTFRVLSDMLFMIVDTASQNYHFVIINSAFFAIIRDNLFMDHILKVLWEGTFNEMTRTPCKLQLVNKDWNEMIQSCPMDLFCLFPRYQSVRIWLAFEHMNGASLRKLRICYNEDRHFNEVSNISALGMQLWWKVIHMSLAKTEKWGSKFFSLFSHGFYSEAHNFSTSNLSMTLPCEYVLVALCFGIKRFTCSIKCSRIMTWMWWKMCTVHPLCETNVWLYPRLHTDDKTRIDTRQY